MGYEDELFQIELDRKKEIRAANGFLFENVFNNQLVIKLGQRYKYAFQFKRALEVQAIWDGIKLCKLENTSTCVSCECSNLDCDWKIIAVKEHKGSVFIISDITLKHTCKKRLSKLQWGTKWIAAKFFHRWKQNAHQQLDMLGNEIAATYRIQCPIWKLNAIDTIARMWLKIDDGEGYVQLL